MDTALQDADDAYNTENARIYFGPLTTPERKFISDTVIVPPPDSSAVVAGGAALVGEGDETDDTEDASRVEELVGGADDEGDNGQEDEIPFGADYVEDEPSSALAMRISTATGNPSPPPSPILPTAVIRSSEPNVPEMSPKIHVPHATGDVQSEGMNPLLPSSTETPSVSQSLSPSPPKDDRTMDVDIVFPSTPPQADLINFDPLTPIPLPSTLANLTPEHPASDPAVSVVDTLLMISPPETNPVAPTIAQTLSTSSSERKPCQLDSISLGCVEEQAPTTLDDLPDHSNAGLVSQMRINVSPLTPPVKPLRRSPRKSVALATAASSIPKAPTPRRSISGSGSPQKKKIKVDDGIEDSQDEHEKTTRKA
ncbi:hypothetical protein NMY22_g4106 [Coprinellus aureogranulatus]|nr:hypothetical protein NMY22_g4106 [Coprinellus aureogranulatus]